jgi:hypothetical protein
MELLDWGEVKRSVKNWVADYVRGQGPASR